jgi:hypothetical protein
MKTKLDSPFRTALCVLALAAAWAVFAPAVAGQSTKGIPDGYSLIDGDILMPTSYVNAVLNRKPGDPLPQDATVLNLLWTNGIVRFEFDANVTAPNQSLMISAMAVLESAANVHFEQCPGNVCNFLENHVHIQNSTANNSQVGMVGFEQIINIVSWNSQFIIVHELLHCLGFYHEQSRADRNSFISVNCGNVQGGCNGTIYNNNFIIESFATVYGYYDFDSLMHYDQCSFSTDCPAGSTCACTNFVITFVVTPPAGVTVGQRTHLSALDKATASFLYPNSDWRFFDCTTGGSQTGTFWNPYATLASALANTPAGGTIWVLNNCSIPTGTYSNSVTIRTAPGVTATFGG